MFIKSLCLSVLKYCFFVLPLKVGPQQANIFETDLYHLISLTSFILSFFRLDMAVIPGEEFKLTNTYFHLSGNMIISIHMRGYVHILCTSGTWSIKWSETLDKPIAICHL